MPPHLRQLEVTALEGDHVEVLEAQQQVITALTVRGLSKQEVQQLLPRLPNLTVATVDA
jgi:hypothetical protein